MLEELPDLKSSVYRFVSDADIGATYPTGEIIMNLSRETTMLEFCKIKGIAPDRQRAIGLDVTGGPANAIALCCEVLKAPTPMQLLDAFKQELEGTQR